MLVLTRRKGEAVYVGENIKIIVVGMKDGSVRLGFEAPREVSIQRDDVKCRIEKK